MVRVIARLQSMAPRIPANPELLFNTFPACRCHREFNKFTSLVYLGCCDDALLNSLMNPSASYWAKGMLGWNAAEQNFHGAALGAPLRQPRERPLQVQPWTELIYSGFWNLCTFHFFLDEASCRRHVAPFCIRLCKCLMWSVRIYMWNTLHFGPFPQKCSKGEPFFSWG